MAKGNAPDFRVYVTQKGDNGDNFYKEIGAAWKVAKGGISLTLFALPPDGKLVMFPPKADGEAGATS